MMSRRDSGERKMQICNSMALRRVSRVDEQGGPSHFSKIALPEPASSRSRKSNGSARELARLALVAATLLAWGITPATAEDIIRFGAAVSLTGPLSTEAKQMKDGYDF